MKKFTLLLVAALFSALSFAALNPFAYGLSSSLNPDQTELTVNYSLNATATNVDFVLLDGDKVIKTVNLNDKGLAKSTYTAVIALDDPNMPLGKQLSWKIEVKGAAVSGYTMHDVKYNAYHPSSVDIDNNPESAHFGRILCNESMQKVKGLTKASAVATNGKNYLGTENGAGIFEFDAAFEYKGSYNGGKTFPINRYGVTGTASANQAYVPRRIRISDDGRIFVTSLNSEGDVLWELNPDNLNEWTTVIADGTRSTTYTETRNIVDGSGNFIAGPNAGFDVHGSGKDLKLVMLSSADEGWGFNQSAFKCVEYNLGTQKTWNKQPSKTIFTKLALYPLQAQVQYDKDGGVWFTQYNSETNNSGKPGLAHWNVNNTNQKPDYIIERNNTRNAGFRYNNDYSKVIIANNSGNASIYDVTIDQNGVPQLSNEVAVNMTAMGSNLNDFAWDYADNIYVVSNSKEFVAVYPSPHDADKVVATPCASNYAFTINSAAQAAKASELNPYAYDLSSELSSDKKTLTIHYKLNANADAVSAVIMNGEIEVKSFACTGITRGEHSIAIPTAELPIGLKLTWQIKVDGTSKSVPTKVSTQYSLWGPYGLDIDKNPESEYFGRILATESYHSAKDLTGYLSTGQGGGLYVFTPDFATDGKVRNGEVNFTRKLASKGFQPFRVRISEDGRIFVTSLDINGVAVWEVSKDLQTWTPLLAGTNNSSDYRIYYNTSTFLAAPNASIDVTGTGDNLKLLLYSASKDAISAANQKWFRLDEYAMNGVETGEAFPTSNTHKAIKAFNGYNLTAGSSTTYKYGVAYNQSAVIYDGEGGYWFAGSRGNNVATEPNLAHVNASGVQDYYNTSDQMLGGAGILIHNHSIKGKVLIKGTKPAGTFKVYALGKNADGTPKLDEIWTVTSGLGTNHNAFAMDYAENLYVVGNNNEKIFAFAMPYSGSVTTPCAAKYAFELEARGVVKRAVQLGESTIVLTHDADGTPYLYNVVGDVMTPISQNGVIARDADNPGDYLSISDIAVTEDGKLVACNYVRCQFVEGNVESGYKRGTLTFYVWNDLASDPAIWFQSKASSNSVNSDQGYTMAVAGTSSNADILVTGVHNTQRGVRMSHFSVIDGVYQDTENGQPNLPYYYFLGKKFKNTSAGVDAAVYREDAHGANFQLSVSPLAKENWIMDAELMEPSEFTNPQTSGLDPVVNSNLTEGTLGKKYTGATYFTIKDWCFMAAPYANASGEVVGVKILNITRGLAGAEELTSCNLLAPIAASAAATAVKVDDWNLTITLVVDAALYEFSVALEAPKYTRSVTNGNYGTICLPYGSSDYSGAEFYEIAYLQLASDGITPANIYLDQVITLEAGKPYIFKATADELVVYYEGAEALSPEAGEAGLTGTFEAIPSTNDILEGNYMIAQNKFWLCAAGCWLDANRAYIEHDALHASTTPVAPMPGRRRVSMGAAGENAATGSEDIMMPISNSKTMKIIENGQVIIIRDGVKYNMQGMKIAEN